jgi:membrane-bound inhibitor of C-type lysozyme
MEEQKPTCCRYIWVFAGVFVLLAIGAGAYVWGGNREALIGGQKDAHGCLVAAGYSWCEAKNSCIRQWEEYCTAAAPKQAVFECEGGKSITATFYPTDDAFVDLVLSDERKMSVPRAISASGARYANADESFVFWNKGDTAFITEGETTTFAGCVTGE